MSSNDPYYLNLVIMLAILAIGVAAGYFTARRNGQETVVSLKNELITTLSQKVKQLGEDLVNQRTQFEGQLHDQRVQFESEIAKLKKENERLTSLIDDLMTMEESRKRAAVRKKITTTHVQKTESEQS